MDLFESKTTRIAGGLDFTVIGGKRQGAEVPQSLETTRRNRVQSPAVAGFGKPNQTNPNLRRTSNYPIFHYSNIPSFQFRALTARRPVEVHRYK